MSNSSKQSLRVFQAHYEQVQAECLRRVPVPDPVTGRWKRPRPEHAERPTQYVKEPDEEDHLPQTLKKRATSATPGHGILNELAERLGNFHESARALASCLQKTVVPRKTDQSMIEAAKCMFHKLLGEIKGRLGSSDTTVTRRALYLDQAQQTTMFACGDFERESLPLLRGIERKICTSNVNGNPIAAIFS